MTPYTTLCGQDDKPVPPLVDLINRVLDPDRASGDGGPSSSHLSDSESESSSGSAPDHPEASEPLKLPLRKFVWGSKLVRNALPHYAIPAWLDPLDVDVDDPRKLPLCWYGVPFYSDLVFAYAQRIRVAVYMKHENLNLKPGDLDIYETWPKFVDWFKGESGFTMHLHQVWDEREPLLTFFSNHEMARVTDDMWRVIGDLLDEIDYPKECKPMWYLDRRLDHVHAVTRWRVNEGGNLQGKAEGFWIFALESRLVYAATTVAQDAATPAQLSGG
ncbi:hypothetical protein GSI_10183 [Ganoderma sinense ZZ0214-1]|uniref:Uncharacterized protein n=1 Tax=Ganoderma sinense ZZ0214-1 TaxID=1077348 RepID=A0A2G8RZX7_9APHY|nr:hypothetical protein GSI_10183 [Ganoderma sinense ZZ0214-1]